jgi:Tfp pilus assembly protein FimV
MSGSSIKLLLFRLGIVGTGLFPVLSCAMGLSDIQVDSRLNQPLRAHIEVLDVSDEEWRSIHPRLAREVPGDGAVVHPELLDTFTLRTSVDSAHRHFIEIQSSQILTEPMFDLPVEVAGNAARVIRSYSILLDPPAPGDDVIRKIAGPQGTVAAKEATITQGPQVGRAQATSAQARTGMNAQSSRTAANSSAASESDTDSGAVSNTAEKSNTGATSNTAALQTAVYTVNKYDTLGRIVHHLGGRTAADRKQMMQWIFEHNPSAFYGNMHHLHTGAHLTLPVAIPTSTARSARQNAAPAPEAATSTRETAANAREASAPASTAADAANVADQEKLASQLETLQQTLSKMQATISVQNAEISTLTRKVAAGAQAQAGAAEDDAEDVPSGKPLSFYVSIGLGATTLIGVLLAVLLWKRSRSEDPTARPRYPLPAVRDADQGPADFGATATVEIKALNTVSAESSNGLRPAQAALAALVAKADPPRGDNASARTPSSNTTPAATVENLDWGKQLWGESEPESPATWHDPKPMPRGQTPDPATEATGYTEELPGSYFEELPEAYTARLPKVGDTQRLATRSTPTQSATIQSSMTAATQPLPIQSEEDTIMLDETTLQFAEDTVRVPQESVRVPHDTVRMPKDIVAANNIATLGDNTATTVEARALILQDGNQSLANKEVVEILQSSLGSDPNRVDIRIKLLEIYHHEVQGNRSEFNTMLNQLFTDTRLTPAQRDYLENLQKTLGDEKPENAADFVTKVAI